MAYLDYSAVATYVAQSNRSTFSAFTVISLIWKESRFDPKAKAGSSTATGLMQMTKTALGEVNRVKKTAYNHADMTDPAKNIETGTTYLSICLTRKGEESAALDYYGTGKGYSTKITAAAAALAALPSPVTSKAATTVLIDKIGKQ